MRHGHLALLLLWASAASAQALSAFSLERLRLNEGLAGGLVVATGDVLAPREARVGLAAHYEREPLVLLADGVRQGAVVDGRLTAHLLAAFGLLSGLQVAAEVPVVLSQQGQDFSALGVAPVASMGLGSPSLGVRGQVVSQEHGGLLKEGSLLDVAVGLGVGLPLGSAAALAQESGVVVSPQLSLGRKLGAVRVGGEATFLVRSVGAVLSTGTAGTMQVGSEALVGVGVSGTVSSLLLEASGRVTVPLAPGQTPPAVELLFGARGPVGPVELFVIGGPGFGHLPGTPSFRLLGGLTVRWPQPRAVAASPDGGTEGERATEASP